MKQQFTLFFIFCFVSLSMLCRAQTAVYDSVPHKTSVYQVKKKKETILSIAASLKLDLQTISYLNDSMPVDKVLQPGQKIIIPVNPMDEKQPEKKNSRGLKKMALSKSDTVAMSQAALQSKPFPIAVDTELIQNKILLADATLDLNRALLQGIQASLDSLNVKDKSIIDEKNISATIHHMQRQRDKAMLTPVLLHMKDSLQNEINLEEKEKAGFESMLGKKETALPKTDSLYTEKAAIKNTVTATVPVNTFGAGNKPTKSEEVKLQPEAPDTLTVLDTSSQAQNATKTSIREPDKVRPVVEASLPSDIASPLPVMHWETAKAIYYNDDTSNGGQSASHFAAEVPAAGSDTGAYRPVSKDSINQDGISMSDTAKIVKAQYFFTKALKASNEKDFKAAAAFLKQAIDISPKYYDAWFALGEADAHQGFYTRALNEFVHCKTLDSSRASLFYKIGTVQVKLKQKSDAFNSFNRALKLDSNYVPAIISRAAEYTERNQFRTAIREYARVIKIDPSYHTVYKSKAMAEYALQSYPAAIEDLGRFLIFNETDGSVYYYRAMAKLKLKQKGSDLIDACTDLSVSARLGFPAALKALEANCK